MSAWKPAEGYLGNLTPTQQSTLDQFRKELTDEGWFVPARHDDSTLLRFLRARKWVLANAKEMIINAEKWRKDFGVDELVKNFTFPEQEQVNEYYPQYYHKTDKDGRPIYVEQLGKLDLVKLEAITTQKRLLERFVVEYEKFETERLPASSAEVGHPVETSCTIMDLNGLSIKNFSSAASYVQQTSSIGQNYYPERMGKFYIINAPFLFTTIWVVVKRWLDPVTVAKIDIIRGTGTTELLKQIPPQNLPAEFGGQCKCAKGCSLSNEGPWNVPTATTSAPAPTTT